MTDDLFKSYQLGDLTMPNRMVMAPMTRNRADENGVPKPMTAIHYAQRACAGLIITEATQIAPSANGYMFTPGIHNYEQARGVAPGDRCGSQGQGADFPAALARRTRVPFPLLQPDGQDPLAPSAIKADTMVFTPNGYEPAGMPRALALSEIPAIAGQFAEAAKLADTADFDGVEVHGANGYLLEQFLKDGTNRRTDALWRGHSIPPEIPAGGHPGGGRLFGGPGRVGLRISPLGTFNDMYDSNPHALYGALAEELNAVALAYLHVIEPLPGHPTFKTQEGAPPVAPELRKIYKGTLMINGGYDRASGGKAVAGDAADLVAFGVPFLANPGPAEPIPSQRTPECA